MRRLRIVFASGRPIGTLAAGIVSLVLPLAAQTGLTSQVDVSSFGVQGWGTVTWVRPSGDGRFVAFDSWAHNLVFGDLPDEDVFVHDRWTGVTVKASVNSAGVGGDGGSSRPDISADGRSVVFESFADNLAPATPHDNLQIFLRDLQIGTTDIVSVSNSGVAANTYCLEPTVSADGRYVAFNSSATNLVPGDTNGSSDIFVRDRLLGRTSRVSVSSTGAQASGSSFLPSFGGDGRYVAFGSYAYDLVPGDTNGASDVFVHDQLLGTTLRASVGASGQQSDKPCWGGRISAGGGFVAFSSDSAMLVPGDTNGFPDVFVRDLLAGATVIGSLAPGGLSADGVSMAPFLSADGRRVAFQSSATNLVLPDDYITDVFVRDMLLDQVWKVSKSSLNVPSIAWSSATGLSADGRVVAFSTTDHALVPSSLPGQSQSWFAAYVHELPPGPLPARYCEAKQNSQGCWPTIGWSGTPDLSGADDFHVLAAQVLNQKPGLLIWGTAGQMTLFSAAFLCVVSPKRTVGQFSGGNPPPDDCSGSYDFHVSNAFLAAQGIGAGQVLYAQFWSRDTGYPPPLASGLTQGLHFSFAP